MKGLADNASGEVADAVLPLSAGMVAVSSVVSLQAVMVKANTPAAIVRRMGSLDGFDRMRPLGAL
jgi:hypothetical protein